MGWMGEGLGEWALFFDMAEWVSMVREWLGWVSCWVTFISSGGRWRCYDGSVEG